MNVPDDQADSWTEQLEAVKLATNGNGAWPCVHANSVATRLLREIGRLRMPAVVAHEQAESGKQ